MFDTDFRLSLISALTPSEVYDVVDQVLSAADSVVPAESTNVLRQQINSLTELNGTLGTALGKGGGANPFTQAKTDSDAARDTAYSRFLRGIDDTLSDPAETAELRDAAGVLNQILQEHPRNLHRLQDAENTAQLDALLEKITEPGTAASAAVTALGLDKFVTRMQDANAAFKQAVQDAAAADVAARAVHDWDAARPVRWLGSLFASNLAYLGETDPAFASVAGVAAELINNATAIARARKTRRSNEDEPPASENEPEAPA